MEKPLRLSLIHILTLPLLKPILVYVLVTSRIGGLHVFDVPQVLTDGKGTPNRCV